MDKTICKADIRVTRFFFFIIMALIDLFAIIVFKDALIASGNSMLRIIVTISIILLFPAIFITLCDIRAAKKSSLRLTETGISGARKKLSSNSELNLPIDKIDSIYIHNGIMDKLEGGKTLMIRSVSGVIKFPWVQNAEEFRDAVTTKIEEYKKSIRNDNKNLISAVVNNASGGGSAQKIKELKELLDQGLISQDEFEAKRKELLSKL